MNVLSPPRSRILIAFVHDLVCPWCYIGLRRLLRAVANRPDISADLRFHPFLLNPDMPRAGMPRSDYIARKFGGNERAQRMQNTIREIGLQEGIFFRFDTITRTPATINAHRLVRFANRHGETLPVVEAIFAAYFNDGRDIGDIGTLVAIAAEQGLPVRDATDYLAGNEDCECVHHDNLTAHRLGISGVPCFIFGDSLAIAGAQEPEVIERLFDAALYDIPRSCDFQ